MKKSLIISLVVIVSLINLISAEIRINEVELNPKDSCNDCTEWIELYSDSEIDLSGWIIKDASNKSSILNFSFSGYYIVENMSITLNNANEKLYLYNGNQLISQTILLSDSYNDNRSWQYCDGEWKFAEMTRGYETNCSTIQNSTNNTNTDQNNTNNENEEEISLEMDWDEEDLVNGEEFDIGLAAFNLKNENYDVRVYLTFEDNDTIISERYDEENDEWKSGTYYLTEFFKGSGNKTGDITLRIRDTYEDFKGDAKIYFKLRDGEEIEENIEILEREESDETKTQTTIKTTNTENKIKESTETKTVAVVTTGNTIRLGTSSEKENNSNLVYESKSEKMKKYSIFLFAFLCLFVCVLIIFKKMK